MSQYESCLLHAIACRQEVLDNPTKYRYNVKHLPVFKAGLDKFKKQLRELNENVITSATNCESTCSK